LASISAGIMVGLSGSSSVSYGVAPFSWAECPPLMPLMPLTPFALFVPFEIVPFVPTPRLIRCREGAMLAGLPSGGTR